MRDGQTTTTTNDERRRTREDRATQPLDAGRLSFTIFTIHSAVIVFWPHDMTFFGHNMKWKVLSAFFLIFHQTVSLPEMIIGQKFVCIFDAHTEIFWMVQTQKWKTTIQDVDSTTWNSMLFMLVVAVWLLTIVWFLKKEENLWYTTLSFFMNFFQLSWTATTVGKLPLSINFWIQVASSSSSSSS